MYKAGMAPWIRNLIATLLLCAGACHAAADLPPSPWSETGGDGRPLIHLYFFWSLTCPHCTTAYPQVEAIARERPWLYLHALELTRHPDNVRRYRALAHELGETAASVPALLFCGEMQVGWGEGAADFIRQRVDACHARPLGGASLSPAASGGPPHLQLLDLPFFGAMDPAALSLPTLTLVLAALDAFNPCAFFVLLFLLSMLAHQKSRARMLAIGGIFVLVSGLMYFAFMAAWLNAFLLFGHLAWVTLAAGALALFVGVVNVKDFFLFERGLSLSIPDSKKPDIFRRTRAILDAERLPAMLAATVFLAVAANFYELLCTAGFPMVYTRLLTLSELSPAGRYAYLAAYNLIYIVPLALIVFAFARTLGARKLSEREGRLLKLLSGTMMLELGLLLLLAPELLSHAGVAFALLALAVGVTWIAARLSRASR